MAQQQLYKLVAIDPAVAVAVELREERAALGVRRRRPEARVAQQLAEGLARQLAAATCLESIRFA